MKPSSPNYVLSAVAGFFLWGLFPIYFKILENISPWEIILHRVVWSFVFVGCFIIFFKKTSEIKKIIQQKKNLIKLPLSALLICSNWFIFIYGVHSDQILETSLGYYTSPLITIMLGIFIFKEKIKSLKKIALVLAIVALILKIYLVHKFSLISLGVAVSFSGYGLVKKTVQGNSLTAFLVEIGFLLIPALVYWGYLLQTHQSHFILGMEGITFLLLGLGLVTATPLLLFSRSVKYVDLSIIGFIQYLTPTMSFFIAILIYQENFSLQDFIVFAIIWVAVILVSIENYYQRKKTRKTLIDQPI